MYLDYFGLKELPFSIAPDPRYLYMSERHREALAHLLFGVSAQGGFVLLTGEVGTGKTTTCRCFLDQVPDNTDVAFIVNPKLSSRELLASICDELELPYPETASIKKLNDVINEYLLNAHAVGRHTVLIIDEAQNLQVEVLEQLRLLTNLETSEKKLLQIVLLGQPELREILEQPELRQLAQRVTARYHLSELNKKEVQAYVKARLGTAGRRTSLFTDAGLNKLYHYSKGVPRIINLIADRALLGAYATQSTLVDASHVKQAYREVRGEKVRLKRRKKPSADGGNHVLWAACATLFLVLFGLILNGPLGTKLESGVEDLSHYLTSGQSERKDSIRLADLSDHTSETKVTDSLPDNESESGSLPGNVSNTLGLSQFKSVLSESPRIEAFTLLEDDRMGRYKAFNALFKRWGENYREEPFILACEFAKSKGLGCLHKQGNWRSLFNLDRPAVLSLINENGQRFYVALLGVENLVEGNQAEARLSFRGDHLNVRLEQLDQYWLGEYSIVWKMPPYELSERNVKPVNKDAWLAEQFMQIEQPSTEGGLLIEPLSQRIKRFQSSLGLVPDGIAGALTLIALNSKLDQSVPRLLSVENSMRSDVGSEINSELQSPDLRKHELPRAEILNSQVQKAPSDILVSTNKDIDAIKYMSESIPGS